MSDTKLCQESIPHGFIVSNSPYSELSKKVYILTRLWYTNLRISWISATDFVKQPMSYVRGRRPEWQVPRTKNELFKYVRGVSHFDFSRGSEISGPTE